MTKKAAGSVDEYIQALPVETQKVLEQVRAQIRALVPEVVERISYGMPTFDVDGRYLIYVGGWKKHISIYPVSEGAADALADEIQPYLSGSGTLKFPLSRELPMELIRRFIQVRVREVATR